MDQLERGADLGVGQRAQPPRAAGRGGAQHLHEQHLDQVLPGEVGAGA
nr:hypothetical protein [Solirubrobacter pauli]